MLYFSDSGLTNKLIYILDVLKGERAFSISSFLGEDHSSVACSLLQKGLFVLYTHTKAIYSNI